MGKDKTQMIIDIIWLVVMMVGIIISSHMRSILSFLNTISLMIWYATANYLISNWRK